MSKTFGSTYKNVAFKACPGCNLPLVATSRQPHFDRKTGEIVWYWVTLACPRPWWWKLWHWDCKGERLEFEETGSTPALRQAAGSFIKRQRNHRKGELYYYITSTNTVSHARNRGRIPDNRRLKYGNYYRTKQEAEQHLENQ